MSYYDSNVPSYGNYMAMALREDPPMKVYCVEVDSTDVMAVRDAVYAVLQGHDLHLGSIMAYADGKTVIQHWCDQEAARAAAETLTRAGFTAREKAL